MPAASPTELAGRLRPLCVAAETPVRTEVQASPPEEGDEALLTLKDGHMRGTGVLSVG